MCVLECREELSEQVAHSVEVAIDQCDMEHEFALTVFFHEHYVVRTRTYF